MGVGGGCLRGIIPPGGGGAPGAPCMPGTPNGGGGNEPGWPAGSVSKSVCSCAGISYLRCEDSYLGIQMGEEGIPLVRLRAVA